MNTAKLITLGILRGSGAVAFSPLSISGLALWLDASDSTTLFQASDGTTPAAADNDVVGYWGDKSGAGRNAIQATTGNKPVLKTASQNGRNSILLATGNYLEVAHDAGLALTGDSTVLIVLNFTSLSVRSSFISKDAGAMSGGAYYYLALNTRSTVDRPFVEAGVSATDGMVAGTRYLVTTTISGTTVSHRLNNASNGTDTLTTGTSVSTAIKIGAFSDGILKNYYQGHLCEILLYSTALVAGQIDALGTYLNTKWAVY